MQVWTWVILVIVIAAVFLLISGEVILALVLGLLWTVAIWALVSYSDTFLGNAWPAVIVVLCLAILSIITLAVVASKLEDRRFHD